MAPQYTNLEGTPAVLSGVQELYRRLRGYRTGGNAVEVIPVSLCGLGRRAAQEASVGAVLAIHAESYDAAETKKSRSSRLISFRSAPAFPA